ISQLLDARLSVANRFQRRRLLQPLGQMLLSHPRAHRAQELEQATPAKQVKIGCVNMMRIIETVAALTGPAPAILDALQSLAVEIRRALRSRSIPARSAMGKDKGGERNQSQYEPTR